MKELVDPDLKNENPIQADMNTYRPFFEIDEPNDYEETLNKIQLATYYLHKIGKSQIASDFEKVGSFLVRQSVELYLFLSSSADLIKVNPPPLDDSLF